MEKIKEKQKIVSIFEDNTDDDSNGILVVYNDEINTFEHVIFCFMTYCGLNYDVSSTYALVIHTRGKAEILSGKKSELRPIMDILIMNYLDADVIDDEEN